MESPRRQALEIPPCGPTQLLDDDARMNGYDVYAPSVRRPFHSPLMLTAKSSGRQVIGLEPGRRLSSNRLEWPAFGPRPVGAERALVLSADGGAAFNSRSGCYGEFRVKEWR